MPCSSTQLKLSRFVKPVTNALCFNNNNLKCNDNNDFKRNDNLIYCHKNSHTNNHHKNKHDSKECDLIVRFRKL